ncbi:MAG: prolipoprotein diacylglyceryl transferase [Clostridiales bacterium]|nr:prolipoprotein diacylglyceryl transferase [Clostridiales bacterium]
MNVISFPRLGIHLNISPVAFHIGAKEIYWYALIILAGFFLGALFVTLTCEKRGIKKDTVWDVALYGLIFGIIGARIYYVLFALDEFDSLLDMLKIYNGGLAIYGGIIGAFLSTYVYCRKKKLSMLAVADVCVPGLLIGQAVGRYGNFTNAEVYGGETSSILGMSINGAAPVHPLFLYESLWNLAGLALMLAFRDKAKFKGQTFVFYIFWYSLGRLFLEGMRDPAYILYLIPGVLGISQLVAAIGVIGSVVFFVIMLKRKNGV